MPVLNDLDASELADLATHGVTFEDPAPAAEPVAAEPVAPAPVAAEPVAPVAPVAAPVVADLNVARDPTTGQFVTPVAPAAAPVAAVDPATGLPAAQPAPAAPPPGFVPHAALHAERQRASEALRNFNLLQTRMNAMLAAQAPAQPPAMPAMEQDPVGYLQALEQRVAAFEQAQAQDQQYRQVDNAIEQDEQTFLSYTPDYPQASDHYVKSRAQELLITHTPEQAKDVMTQEVRAIANAAWQRGIPAAQMIYQLAQSRGYRTGQAAPAAPATAAPVAPTPPPSPAAIVDSVTRAQQQSRSLSGTGAANTATLNAEAILAMSDDEFERTLGLGTKAANANFAAIAGA